MSPLLAGGNSPRKVSGAAGCQSDSSALLSAVSLPPGKAQLRRPLAGALEEPVNVDAMKAVVQRVAEARVRVGGQIVGEIGPGLCVLLGVARDDESPDAERLAGKVARLRIFENADGKFDRSVEDVGGAALVVSQFTLIADTEKGNRPSFAGAAPPEEAGALYEAFCAALRGLGLHVETGVFGARMLVEITNDGPVTIVLEV